MLKDECPIPIKTNILGKKRGGKARNYVSNNTLLISVRNKRQQDLWLDFKAYLITQRQNKSRINNKLFQVQRFNHILEQKDAHDLLKLSYNIESLDYMIEKYYFKSMVNNIRFSLLYWNHIFKLINQ